MLAHVNAEIRKAEKALDKLRARGGSEGEIEVLQALIDAIKLLQIFVKRGGVDEDPDA